MKTGKKRFSILSKFFLVVGLILIVPTISITLGYMLSIQNIWSNRLVNELRAGAEGFNARLELEMKALVARVSGLAGEPVIKTRFSQNDNVKFRQRSTIRDEDQLLLRYSDYTAWFMNLDGQIFFERGRPVGAPTIDLGIASKFGTSISATWIEAASLGLRLYAASKVYYQDAVAGYLVAALDLVRSDLDALTIGPDHHITIIDRTSKQEYYSSIKNRLLPDPPGPVFHSHGFADLQSDDILRTESFNGDDYLTWHIDLPASGRNRLVAEISLKKQEVNTLDVSQPLLVLMVLVIILVLTSTIMLTRILVAPVLSLAYSVDSMRRHIRDYAPLVTIPVKSNDEVGELARAINGLAGELRASTEKIEIQRAQIAAYTHSLEQRVRERTQEMEEARIRAEIANKHKSKFLVNMNHELRTPLNSIAGMTDLLRFGAYEKNEQLAQVLEQIIGEHRGLISQDLAGLVGYLGKRLPADNNWARVVLGYLKQQVTHHAQSAEASEAGEKLAQCLQELAYLVDDEERQVFRAYNSMRDACDSLLHIIDEVINLSQIESGVIIINKSKVRLADLLQTCMVHAEAYASSKRKQSTLDFFKSIEAEVPEYALLDYQKIKQVILNLLTNAVKYTVQGFVSCRFDLSSEQGLPLLRVSVQDSGRGISIKDRARLFTEFGRVFEVREIEGSGLGLALSRRLVEKHGGELDFTSEEAKGSIFWFTVPLENVD